MSEPKLENPDNLSVSEPKLTDPDNLSLRPRPESKLQEHEDYLMMILMAERNWKALLHLMDRPDMDEWLDIRFARARQAGLTGPDPARLFLQMAKLVPDLDLVPSLNVPGNAALLCDPERLFEAWEPISIWVNAAVPEPQEPWEQRFINLYMGSVPRH